MRKFLILFLFLFLIEETFSQYQKNYSPLTITDTIPTDLQKIMNARLDSDKMAAKSSTSNKDMYKYKCGLYEDRTNSVVKLFNEDYFMIDSIFTPYLQRIANKIYAANPSLKNDTRIFAYRSSIPNAVCFGEGTIAFNLGLLNRIENESQVAFILSHELAHYHMKHADKRINKITELNFDKTLASEVKEIQKQEFNQYSKLKELLKDLTFDITRHSRVNENEADSVGLSYLLKTSYDPWQAIRAMEILDSIDLPVYSKNLDLKKIFNAEQYPFKDIWLEYDTLDFVYAKDMYSDSDTASTHPDCKKRIKAMRRQLVKISRSETRKSDAFFKDLLIKSEFETIESLYHFGNLGRALYLTLIQLEKYPDNAYLNAMVGKCFYMMHYYQKKKEFGKVVSNTDNRFPESYNRFLAFLHNLRMIEMANISYNYVFTRSDKYMNDEEFLYSMILNSDLPVGSPDKKAGLIKKYRESFPAGKYNDQL